MPLELDKLRQAVESDDRLQMLDEYCNVLDQVVELVQIDSTSLAVEQIRAVVAKQASLKETAEMLYGAINKDGDVTAHINKFEEECAAFESFLNKELNNS